MTDSSAWTLPALSDSIGLCAACRHVRMIGNARGSTFYLCRLSDDDPRYPTTTPELHAEKVVEQAKIMMGQSAKYPAAPPYYFCTAFWLMGNAMQRATGWEEHAWFSNRWPGGKLPTVDALAALPKVERPTPTDELAGILMFLIWKQRKED